MSSIIFTHGDCDGICSGAIVKSALPDSTVFFTSPVSLLGELNNLDESYESIVICDIAVDEKTCMQLKKKLADLAKVSKVVYMDHHPLPEKGYNTNWFYHDTCSTSEQAYRIFERKLSRDMRRVAIYFYAGTLIQGITYAGRDYDYKRRIVDALSEEIPPPQIDGLLEAAIIASRKEEEIRILVRQKVVKLRKLAYVVDINGYMSKAAIYAASYGNALVGVSCEYRPHKHVYDLSIRLRNGGVDLNTILRRVSLNHGGTGGGHPFAGGARIPGNHLEAFLHDLDDALCQ